MFYCYLLVLIAYNLLEIWSILYVILNNANCNSPARFADTNQELQMEFRDKGK